MRHKQTKQTKQTSLDINAIRVRKSREIKLKATGLNRYIGINFIRDFGFMPESIIIERVPSCNNKILVMAVLTAKEAEKEDAEMAKMAKEDEARLDALNKK